MKCHVPALLIGLSAVFGQAISLHAAITISFSNGDTFDGDAAGDSAGPFLDSETGVAVNVNTVGIGGGGQAVNTTAGRLGIVGGTGTGASSRFNSGESWVLNFDSTPIDLLGIDFGLFTGPETYRLESTAWANAAYDAPGSAVSFSSNGSSGFFTFSDRGTSDLFSLSDFTSSGLVSIASGNDVVLTYTGSDSNGSVLESLTVRANPQAVPEPATLVLAGVATGVTSLVHWRRRRKQNRL